MSRQKLVLPGAGQSPRPPLTSPPALPRRASLVPSAAPTLLPSLTGRALRCLFTALALLAALSFCPASGLAHAVYIFAWPEADRICSESYFSKKNKVRGGTVEVYNAHGTLLASGTSDEAGGLCFAGLQNSGDLLFVVKAGQGHRGEFLLPAAPVSDLAQPPAATPAPVPDTASATTPVQAPATTPATTPVHTAEDLQALIRATVREEIHRELEPLRRALVERKTDSGPSWREVLGGLGWIAGLAGFGAWYAARRRGQ